MDLPSSDPLTFYSRKFHCMKMYATDVIKDLTKLPLESMVHKDLQFVKFILGFMLTLKCIFSHDNNVTLQGLAKVDSFAISVLDIQVKLASFLTKTKNSPNAPGTFDFGRIPRHAQRVMDCIFKVLEKWPQEMVPGDIHRRQFCIEYLYKTLQTRCAMTHFYFEGQGTPECSELYAQAVSKLNEMLKA